jgi:NAD+ diphosphatase
LVASATALPFNFSLLGGEYQPLRPGEPVSTTPGHWLILQGQNLVVAVDEQGQYLPHGELPFPNSTAGEPLIIGLWQGAPLRTLALDTSPSLLPPFTTLPFHGLHSELDERLATLAGLAGQIHHWELRSRFCSCCSGLLVRIPATWGKQCLSCGAEHFPHIHPCVIVLVRRGDEFLLVRKAEWSSERFSLIAGFLDFGESLEECVQREVMEEAGVAVTDIRYVGSQNWPFPSQQMIGFVAEYAGGEPQADGIEIAETRWCTTETIPRHPGSIRSIARWILSTHASANFRIS